MATHTPKIENTLPTWVFIQCIDFCDERHEIRRVPRGYMVYINVCEATGGGCSTLAVYSTYREAREVLRRFRPTAELVECINGAEIQETDTQPGKVQKAGADTSDEVPAESATLYNTSEITDSAETATDEDSARRLAWLLIAAADFDKLTKDGEHVAAMLTRLSALSSCGVDVDDLIKGANYISDYYARQRAAVVLTPEEFRTLYGYSPNEQPSACAKVWQFERGTQGAIDYELHEIRESGGVYSVIFDVCDLYPYERPLAFSYNSFAEAENTLNSLRHGSRAVSAVRYCPTAELVECINGAKSPEGL